MRLPRPAGPLLVALGLLTAACGGGTTEAQQPSASSSPSATVEAPAATTSSPIPSPTPPAVTGTVITTAPSDFGVMLFDDRNQAIYLFDKETTERPDCYGDCAAAWPPVLTDGAPQATGDARSDLLGTVERDDGSTQVTYAGHPLYFYAHEGPGEVLCHDVVDYGGTWLVVTPEGTAAP
jgi:predicted lipoprotein with Yx(FWY)xxD motif